MAKKIIPDTPAVTGQAGENATVVAETDIRSVQPEVETNRPEVKTASEPSDTLVIDEQVRQILKVYPNYESLYVDRHGSSYTPDTPAMLRRGAVLYKNPFYQPSKTNG